MEDQTKEVEEQVTEQAQEQQEPEADYKAIIEEQRKTIETQSKTIESQSERIDKLLSTAQGLINNHGNYREEPSGTQYHKPPETQKPDDYQPLSELDFSM